MPTVPSYSKCNELGCGNPKAERSNKCESHKRIPLPHTRIARGDRPKKREVKPRNPATAYNSSKWYALRQIQLSRYPLCAACKADGTITSAKHVDHVFPWRHIGDTAFTHNILQSLCHSCHSIKTRLEQEGIYRRYGTPCIDYYKDDYLLTIIQSMDEFELNFIKNI